MKELPTLQDIGRYWKKAHNSVESVLGEVLKRSSYNPYDGTPGGDFVEGPERVKETLKPQKPSLPLSLRLENLRKEVEKKETHALWYLKQNKTKIAVGAAMVAGNIGALGYIENQNRRIDDLEKRVAADTIWEYGMSQIAGEISFSTCMVNVKANFLLMQQVDPDIEIDPQMAQFNCLMAGWQIQDALTPPNIDVLGK